MFQNCSSLPSLNVSNFDTSNVTDMGAMFSSCSNLPSLNVSNFNTSNVTNMSNMFQNCSSLANLNVSNFDTSNVTNMKAMFSGCNNLPSLDVSNFDTSNVTNMFEMFYNCKNLTSINIGANFDKLTGSRMFYSCSNLKAIITPRTSIMTLNADATISTGLKLLPKIVLYVSNVDVETTFESDANYANIFGADRIKPILELVGDNPAKVLAGSTYVDAGVTVAGMTQNANGTTYTPYGYTVSGPVIKKNGTIVSSVDTSTVGSTYTYTYTIKDSANVVGMSVTRTVNVTSVPTLMRRETANSQYYAIGAYRADNSTTYTADKIKTITLLNTQEAPENYIATWDASYTKGDNTVTAWLITNAEDNTMYDLYLGAEGKIYAPSYSYKLLGEYKNCIEINGLNNLETSNVTSMVRMFDSCNSLMNLDASNFNTSKVTDMYGMFYDCSSLTSLNVSGFDTSQTTNMGFMFYNCSSLTSLDANNFDTSKVTNMYSMFDNCSSLTNLDVNNFDTSQVTNMYSMFKNCSSLTNLDANNFDTSQVTNMYSMFSNCSSLTSLNVSGFDTSQTTSMGFMFSSCSSLTNLDISSFDTSKVTYMGAMFSSCSSLTSLDVSNFNTSKVTDMSDMFYRCSSLTSLDVSNFNTSNVTNMSFMFCYCGSLTSLDVSGFDTSNVKSMGRMFCNCSSLTSLDVSGFDTSNVKSMAYMFDNCSTLTSLDVSNFDTSNVTSMNYMFSSCSSLTNLDVSSFDTSNVTSMNYMFYSCAKLNSLKLGQNFDKLTGANMFSGCSNLKAIITPRATVMTLNDNTTTNTGLKTLTNAILYVPSLAAETTFESDTNYADIFGADRIRPILELVGDNPIEIAKGTTYVDSGVTVAGMNKNEDGLTYTPYGYTVSVTGLPVDTSTNEPKVITYTIKDPDGVSGMSVTRTVNMAREDITPTVNMENYTYGGTKSTPTVTGNLGNGAVTYYYNTTNSNANGTLWSTVTSSTSLDAGTYYMYAVIDETANYNGATTPAKAFVINKANGYITLSEETGTVPYGSANKTFTVTSHHGGILTATQTTSAGVAVSVSGTTVTISSMSSVAAGTEIVIKVTSAETTNYAIASADYTLTIGKTNITPTVNMKNYVEP